MEYVPTLGPNNHPNVATHTSTMEPMGMDFYGFPLPGAPRATTVKVTLEVVVLESTTGARRTAVNVGVKDRLKRLRDKPKPNLAVWNDLLVGGFNTSEKY